MHQLSSRWPVISAYIFLSSMVITIVGLVVQQRDLFDVGLLTSWAFIVLGLYVRNVRSVSYDDSFLYVRSIVKKEKISLDEVAAVNVPDSRFDKIYEVELKSGRIIKFIPEWSGTAFLWEDQDVPPKVRRFQMTLRNFERNHGS